MLEKKRQVVLCPSKVSGAELFLLKPEIHQESGRHWQVLNVCSFSLQTTPEPPVFTVKPESQDASPGSNVVLKSAFTGSAPLAVKWFREEKEIFTGGKCFIKKYAFSSSLELHSVKPTDSAKYTCQVSNDAGKEDCTAVLFVKGALSFFFQKK